MEIRSPLLKEGQLGLFNAISVTVIGDIFSFKFLTLNLIYCFVM